MNSEKNNIEAKNLLPNSVLSENKELENKDEIIAINENKSSKNLRKNRKRKKPNRSKRKNRKSKEYIVPVDYDTLVLPGASIKGLITLGALQFAYDNFLLQNVNTYIGTSSGSIICYLLCIGYNPTEIMVYICIHQLIEKMQHFNFSDFINGKGAVSFSKIQENIEKMTIEKIGFLPTLKDIYHKYGKTLICVTYNFTKEKTEYLSWRTHPNLPCLTAIRMSSCLPLLFEMYKYGNDFYIDGGISNNFAIDISEKYGERILGILLEYNKNNFNNHPRMNVLEYIYKLMYVPIWQITQNKLEKLSSNCHVVNIDYDNDIKVFNFNLASSDKLDMFTCGYQCMKKKMLL